MKTCLYPKCENTDLVYSGIDAFMLGNIPTETFCYSCANIFSFVKNLTNEMAGKN